MKDWKIVKVKIFRYDPSKDERPTYETYEVPYWKGMRVLDALTYIADELNQNIAFSYNCGVRECGTCGVLVNGEPKLACWDEAEKEMKIEPLPYFPVIRDLVIDRSGYDSITRKIKPYVERREPYAKWPEDLKHDEIVATMTKQRECLECLLCVSSCPLNEVARKGWSENSLPATMVKLAGFALDPRDGADRLHVAMSNGIYNCTTCKKCEQVCPLEIATPKTVMEKLRQLIVDNGLIENPLIKSTFEKVHKYGNPWGKLANTRDEWTRGLEVRRFQNNDILYFVGCTPSFDSRCQEVAKSLAIIFSKVGVDFGILGNEEKCSGEPILRMGEKGLFDMLMEENIGTFKKYGVHKIVTTSPHCYHTFAKEYKNKDEIEVKHYTQFLWKLIEEGKLTFSRKINKVATYHDPCFLGRYNGVYEAPRKILAAIPGLSLIEMGRSKERSLCCGGGGGGIWTENAPVEQRPSVNCAREAARVNPDVLVTACPFCLINLNDAVQAIEKTERIQVKDIAELVREAM